jgi:hypothetical protein
LLVIRSEYCLSFRSEAEESAFARSTTICAITQNALQLISSEIDRAFTHFEAHVR